MNSKNISRTAAIIYSEDNSVIKSTAIQRKIIESLFVENNNEEFTINQIIDKLKSSLELDFDREEINKLIKDEKKSKFEIRRDNSSGENYLQLENKRYISLKEKEKENSIVPHIEKFESEVYKGKLSSHELYKILNDYLYELLNKNIQVFKKIVKSSNTTSNLDIDPNSFSLEERVAINQFIDWGDNDKNKAIFALISCCIEYAIISNHYESSNVFLKSIKNKDFYLDNNVLYRAIGINGQDLKNQITTFLKKCLSTGQVFKISGYTEMEFKETIKYHIEKLKKVPSNRIDSNLFSKYSLSPGIYNYYHEWRKANKSVGFESFNAHLLLELDSFKKDYKVNKPVLKIPFNSKDKGPKKKISEYQNEIASAKEKYNYEQSNYKENYSSDQSNYYDAVNVYLIEQLRGQNQNSITDTRYFFVSTDQKLRDWDFDRNESQPVALIPSHWMAILLKYHSRSLNDYASFSSFLKLKTNTPVLKNEENLNIVMAGISEITECPEKQEGILNKMVEMKFEGILKEQTNPDEIIYTKVVDLALQEYKKDTNSEKIQLKKNLLREKQNSIEKFDKQIKKQVKKRFKRYKFIFSFKGIICIIIYLIIIYKVGWDLMEPIVYVLGIITGQAFLYLYAAIYGKSFDPTRYFDSKKSKIISSVFAEFDLNPEQFNELKKEVDDLEKEIEELERLHKKTYKQSS